MNEEKDKLKNGDFVVPGERIGVIEDYKVCRKKVPVLIL